jgi:hypothetical protein
MINPALKAFATGLMACLALVTLGGCCCLKPAASPAPAAASATKSPEQTAAPAAPSPAIATSAPAGSTALFDGRSLAGWQITDFAGKGPVTAANGQINVGLGHMTGITLTNTNVMPVMNYELSLEAMRVDGSDFFCGLTFPVGSNFCSFIVGGWGGGVVGLSSLNSEDASQNETTKYLNFANGRWFKIRVRVQPERIQAWIDNDAVVDVDTKEKQLGIRMEMESCTPVGLATWNTAAAWRNILVRKL